MAEKGYKTSTIYQTRIALFNMLEFAKENDVIFSNPCKKSVKVILGNLQNINGMGGYSIPLQKRESCKE